MSTAGSGSLSAPGEGNCSTIMFYEVRSPIQQDRALTPVRREDGTPECSQDAACS